MAEDSPHRSQKEKPLPHYALPNFSVVLPTYSNHESDVIAQAFRIGNYVSLHDLPGRIKPGQVSRGRFQKILENRQASEYAEVPAGRFQSKPKLFSDFEYLPSPYSIVDEIQAAERLEHQAAVEKVGHKKAFVLADTSIKLKYDDAFHGGIPPYKDDADPYECADDQALRHKWLREAQILAGPFRPAGRVKGPTGEAATERPCTKDMREIVEFLRQDIDADWEDYNFIVCATDDEHVVVRFELSTLDSEPGLVAYMNIFARSNTNVANYKLTKVVEDWNVTPHDGHLYFTFRPPWVKARIDETFYSIHPEQRSFHDLRFSSSKASFAATEMQASAAAQSDMPSGASADDGAAVRPDLT